MVAHMNNTQSLARHIIPTLRRIGPGRFPDLERALLDGELPDGVVRDLHRAFQNAEREIADQRRKARQPWLR